MVAPYRLWMTLLLVPLLASCGVKRPLIAPKDIPAHDAKRQKKMEKFRAEAAEDAAKAAATGTPTQNPESDGE